MGFKKETRHACTGIDLEIFDPETGADVPHDGVSVGEICVKGPWITGSYYNAPGTESNFRDGYWRSGDAGTIDEKGYLKIVDRIKDVIKSGGEWISSIDLENAIMGHPEVLEAAVRNTTRKMARTASSPSSDKRPKTNP